METIKTIFVIAVVIVAAYWNTKAARAFTKGWPENKSS
jgi:hypothetical protein